MMIFRQTNRSAAFKPISDVPAAAGGASRHLSRQVACSALACFTLRLMWGRGSFWRVWCYLFVLAVCPSVNASACIFVSIYLPACYVCLSLFAYLLACSACLSTCFLLCLMTLSVCLTLPICFRALCVCLIVRLAVSTFP